MRSILKRFQNALGTKSTYKKQRDLLYKQLRQAYDILTDQDLVSYDIWQGYIPDFIEETEKILWELRNG